MNTQPRLSDLGFDFITLLRAEAAARAHTRRIGARREMLEISQGVIMTKDVKLGTIPIHSNMFLLNCD
jgi:hypothetical protein